MPYDDSSDPALVAAPRHLRRRRFHSEIPDPLLVPDAEPYRGTAQGPGAAKTKRSVPPPQVALSSTHRKKRRIALLCVMVVSLSVPALIAALLVFG